MSNANKTRTTPAGLAGFVCVNKPSTKFKPEGEYSIKLVLDPATAEPLQGEFRKLAEEAKAEFLKKDSKKAAIIGKYALHVPGSDDVDADGNPTGNVVFAFKQAAVITPRDTKKQPFETKIGLFDAKGKPMPGDVLVGRGSKVKVAYEVIPFCNPATKSVGISLRLKAVQILDLKRYSGGTDFAGYGFGQEEGYTAEDAEAPSEMPADGEQAPAGDGEAPGKKADF
jgi:hypothetical protein